MHKRLLLVIYDYFPNSSANTICAKKIIDNLVGNGYQIDVVCVRPYKSLPTFEDMDGIDVYRIENRSDVQYRRLRKLYFAKERGIQRFMGKVLLFLFSHYYKNEVEGYVSKWNTYKVMKVVDELFEKHQYQRVISVSLPYITNEIGYLIKQKYPQIEWIIYELDPFTYNYVLQHEQIEMRKVIENKILSLADKVISTFGIIQENDKQYFRKEFKNKEFSLHLPNLYNIDLSRDTKFRYDNVHFDESKINIVFTGFFYGKIRNPDFILELLNKMNDSAVVLHIYGTGCDDTLFAYKCKMCDNLMLHGRVDKHITDEAIYKADLLLNVGNDLPNQTPSKIFAYMGTGKPIINISYFEEDTSMFYLNKYAAVCDVNANHEIGDKLIRKIQKFCHEGKGRQLTYDEIRERMGDVMSDRVCEEFARIIDMSLE